MATSRTKSSAMASIALAAALTLGATALPTRAPDFVDARTESKISNIPTVVFVHGSSWHPASKRFRSDLWKSSEFEEGLTTSVVLTNVHIKQNQSKEANERDQKKREGWNDKPVKSYPAIQVYGSDGQLVATVFGQPLRQVTTAQQLADLVNPLAAAAKKRTELLKQFEGAKAAGNNEHALKTLCQLIELPIDNEPKIVDMLKSVDPDDTSGWQARITFGNWNFMRHITKMLEKGNAQQAYDEADELLKSNHHTPPQRTIILGAKARALTSLGKLDDAWALFQEAAAIDPDGANNIAILSYGRRTAGIPSRQVFENDSPLTHADIGDNLTKGRASFTLSSQAHDDGSNHHTLFSGPFAPGGSAFHTANEKGAHIIVNLDGKCELRALRIVNRSNIHERAKSLTVWTSNDQQTWTKVWQADEVKGSWDIVLDTPTTASFLKVGLDPGTRNFLHLRAVDAFGKRK